MIHYIASGEDARYASLGGVAAQSTSYPNIAPFHIQLIIEYGGIRIVSDRDKYAVHIQLGYFFPCCTIKSHASNAALITQHFGENRIPTDVDISPISAPVSYTHLTLPTILLV